MKTLILLFVLIPCLASFGYEKKPEEKPEVEKYVELLKSDKWCSDSTYGCSSMNGWISLPAFTHEDIDELLKYRNDTSIVTFPNFPRNSMSSHKPYRWEKYEVRMIILWTIESIRVVAVNSRVVQNGRFPSLNPILTYRVLPKDFISFPQNPNEHYNKWWREKKDIEWQTVSDAYYTWWMQNKDKDLNETMNIYPLQNTDYGWLGHSLYNDH
jgi:hypothetical protein